VAAADPSDAGLAANSLEPKTSPFSCWSGALALAAAALVAVPESASSQARQREWASLSLPSDSLVPRIAHSPGPGAALSRLQPAQAVLGRGR
jgi:hypothetical protein